MTPLLRFVKDEKGTTAIEYALIAVGISVAILTSVQLVGSDVSALYEKSPASSLGSKFRCPQWGHKQTLEQASEMSALPTKADKRLAVQKCPLSAITGHQPMPTLSVVGRLRPVYPSARQTESSA